jgi:hypothetical protein
MTHGKTPLSLPARTREGFYYNLGEDVFRSYTKINTLSPWNILERTWHICTRRASGMQQGTRILIIISCLIAGIGIVLILNS